MVRNYKRKTEDRWSKEDLLKALVCIKNNNLTFRDAARQFGINSTTLCRRYRKFIQQGGKCDVNQFRPRGGRTIMIPQEERILAKTIIKLRNQGIDVTPSDVKRICFQYCESHCIPNAFNTEGRMASDDWYYCFIKRYPNTRYPAIGNSQPGGDPLPEEPKKGKQNRGNAKRHRIGKNTKVNDAKLKEAEKAISKKPAKGRKVSIVKSEKIKSKVSDYRSNTTEKDDTEDRDEGNKHKARQTMKLRSRKM